MEIGLSLGANLGNRLLQLQSAKKQIISAGKISFVTQSPVYETEPVGVPAIDANMFFLNAVLILETLPFFASLPETTRVGQGKPCGSRPSQSFDSAQDTEPAEVPEALLRRSRLPRGLPRGASLQVLELLSLFKRIEHQMGRASDSLPKNARRPIDIDIIYAGNLRVELEDVIVPHPRWFKRRFVVQPLSDVRPDLVIPAQTLTVNEILRNLSDKHRVTLSLSANEW